MKILYCGWVWDRSFKGGSVIYSMDLIEGIRDKGHEVYYLFSDNYNPVENEYGKFYRKDGIGFIKINKPPTDLLWEYNDMKDEISNNKFDSFFNDVLNSIKPDIVHFLCFVGIPASAMAVCLKNNIKYVVTLLNYIPICPKIEMFDTKRLCPCSRSCDLKNTQYCTGCINKCKREDAIYARLMRCGSYNKMTDREKDIYRNKISEELGQDFMPRVFKDLIEKRDSSFKSGISRAKNIAISNRVKEIYEMWGISGDTIDVINLYSDIKKVERVRQNDSFTVGFIGNFYSTKGAEVLIKAISMVKEEGIRFEIFGQFYPLTLPGKDVLEKQHPNLKFMGSYFRDDVERILSRFDAVVIPSVWEECGPLVAVESLSAGVPVIGANTGGIGDYVKEGKNGLLFLRGDAEELKNKIITLYKNRGLYMYLKKNAEYKFTKKDFVNAYENEYFKLLSSQIRNSGMM